MASSVQEAKALVRAEANKVTTSISAILGSRILMAVLATFAIAFAINLIYSPTQLPSVGGLSLAQIGLPANVDFGMVGEQAKQAAEAADREGAQTRAQEFFAANAERIPLINAVGLGLSLVLLLVNMTIMTKRRRVSRG